MSDKTNEEKLRILQERLSQIQQKEDKKLQEERVENSRPVTPVFEENLITSENIEPIAPTTREPRNKSNFLKYLIIFAVISLTGYYLYDFVDFDFDFEANFGEKEIKKEIVDENQEIIYYKSYFSGEYILIINSFNDINLANEEVNELVKEGYNCDVMQLSSVSNSKEEIFQTYIGPFNKLEEANQYLNSSQEILDKGEIIKLQ